METIVILVLAAACVVLVVLLIRATTRTAVADGALQNERSLREQEALAAAERFATLKGERDQLTVSMRSIAGEVLSGTTDQLIKLAAAQRTVDKEAATAELKSRTTEVKTVVAPVSEQLLKLQQQVEKLQQERAATAATVKQMIEQTASELGRLRTETGSLVAALKRPQVRGSWGEIQLRNVVRIAGMTEHVDFDRQVTVTDGDDGRLRPDMTVHLPTGRDIVVDSKVPLDAYLAALEFQDDDDRRAAELDRHARHLRTHIDQLASKSYHARLDRSAEFVVCFIPNEACYVAALDRDPSLTEHGADKGVLLATPTTLVALLRATHYGWRQAAVEESAQAITDAARDLHERVAIFADHYAKVGSRLNGATKAFNDSVGSFEGRLLPQLRRLEGLGAQSARSIDAPGQIDASARSLQAAADEIEAGGANAGAGLLDA